MMKDEGDKIVQSTMMQARIRNLQHQRESEKDKVNEPVRIPNHMMATQKVDPQVLDQDPIEISREENQGKEFDDRSMYTGSSYYYYD